tara:strand:+ start:311 stop:619 length:309 start_codon:yes stop_codon:yes gene_type:complete
MKDKKTHSINHRLTEHTYKQIKDGSSLLGCSVTEFLEMAIYNFYVSDKLMEMAKVHLSELEILISHAAVSRLDYRPQIPKHIFSLDAQVVEDEIHCQQHQES